MIATRTTKCFNLLALALVPLVMAARAAVVSAQDCSGDRVGNVVRQREYAISRVDPGSTPTTNMPPSSAEESDGLLRRILVLNDLAESRLIVETEPTTTADDAAGDSADQTVDMIVIRFNGRISESLAEEFDSYVSVELGDLDSSSQSVLVNITQLLFPTDITTSGALATMNRVSFSGSSAAIALPLLSAQVAAVLGRSHNMLARSARSTVAVAGGSALAGYVTMAGLLSGSWLLGEAQAQTTSECVIEGSVEVTLPPTVCYASKDYTFSPLAEKEEAKEEGERDERTGTAINLMSCDSPQFTRVVSCNVSGYSDLECLRGAPPVTLSWTANVGAESLEAASEEDPVVIEWTLTPVQCSQCTPRLFTSIAQITQPSDDVSTFLEGSQVELVSSLGFGLVEMGPGDVAQIQLRVTSNQGTTPPMACRGPDGSENFVNVPPPNPGPFEGEIFLVDIAGDGPPSPPPPSVNDSLEISPNDTQLVLHLRGFDNPRCGVKRYSVAMTLLSSNGSLGGQGQGGHGCEASPPDQEGLVLDFVAVVGQPEGDGAVRVTVDLPKLQSESSYRVWVRAEDFAGNAVLVCAKGLVTVM